MVDYSTSETQAKSWADLIADVVVHDGETVTDVDIAALAWGATRSRGLQRKHGRKYARTRGTTDYSGSATFFDSGWEAVRQALQAVAVSKNLEIFDVTFDIIAKRKEERRGNVLRLHRLGWTQEEIDAVCIFM
jgi:hypothetical protein